MEIPQNSSNLLINYLNNIRTINPISKLTNPINISFVKRILLGQGVFEFL